MPPTRATQPGQPERDLGAVASEHVFANALCAVDGTHRSMAAVEQAAVLAGPQGHLALLAVTAVRGSGQYHVAAISTARAKLILERAQEIAAAAKVPSTTILDPAGPPAEVILERAAEYDLLAMGPPPSTPLGGMLTDGVAVSALGSFTTPLLIARPLPSGGEPFARRIVVASDGLEDSDGLVDFVARLARVHDASVILVHAIGVESRSHPHRIKEQARRLEEARAGACEVRVEPGDAADAVIHAARDSGASLIVASSRRLGGLHAVGSVSRQLVRAAHCSVLLVAPEHLQR